MKFKVVKPLISDHSYDFPPENLSTGGVDWAKEMDDVIGQIFELSHTPDSSYRKRAAYHLCVPGRGEYFFHPSWLHPLNDSENR